MIIPGGYTGAKDAHAVVFEILRLGQTEYQFSLHNTGDGLKNVSKVDVSFQHWIHQSRLLKINKLSLEDISDKQFLTELIRPNYVASPNNSMYMIYKLISERLEPKGVKEFSKVNYDIQTWGSCSFDSIMCFLKFSMSKDLFDLFHNYLFKKAHKKNC